VRHAATGLTDGAGLLLVRQLWDRFALLVRSDAQAPALGGRDRASTMGETWVTGLLVKRHPKLPRCVEWSDPHGLDSWGPGI
jgi:hypothetical protein